MMQKSVVVLTFLFVMCTGSGRDGYPGYEFVPEVEGFLKLHVEPANYKSARSKCHSEAALLASPWSINFEPAIRKLLSTRFHTIPKVFSGAGLRKDSPGFPLEPCANKRCRMFLASGGIEKVHCDDMLPFVCFAPEVKKCKSGYKYRSEMNECYKSHSQQTIIQTARSICTSEGGFLAYISTDVEQKVLESMSSGLDFIEGGGSEDRHLTRTGYSDYSCTGPHPFICEMLVTTVMTTSESDLID